MEEKDKQPEGFTHLKSWTVVTFVAGSFALNQSVAKGEMIHLPPQAVGALAQASSTSAATSIGTVYIADTTIDRVYEARIAPEYRQAQGDAPKEVTPRST